METKFTKIQDEAISSIEKVSNSLKDLDEGLIKIQETLLLAKEKLNLTDKEFKGVTNALIEMLKNINNKN